MVFNTEQMITGDRRIIRGVSKYKTLLIGGIMLTVIQQMPIIRDRFYGEIRLVLYVIFALISVKSLATLSLMKLPRFIKLFIGTLVLLALEFLVFQLLNWRSSIFELTELLIPFGILISAYSLDFEQKEIDSLIYVYAVLAVLMGVSLVLFYGGGFVLREQYIAGTSKNQTGPILGITSVIILDQILRVDRNSHTVLRFAWLSLLLLGAIASLIVLRNRAGLLAVMLVLPTMVISRSRRRLTLASLITATVVMLLLFMFIYLGFLDPFLDILERAFVLNYDVRDLDSLSAGRMTSYVRGIKHVQLHPFFGELTVSERFFGTPHNYILNKWVRYGLIGSLPFVVLYVYLFVFALRQLFSRSAMRGTQRLAIWLLLFGLIVSLFEYSYPYGPGTSQIMVWFLIGQYLAMQKGYTY